MHFANSLKVCGSYVESRDHESWKYDKCAECIRFNGMPFTLLVVVFILPSNYHITANFEATCAL